MTAAADTNIWVRYLTNDDPDQGRRVLAWLASVHQVVVPVTVIPELEWVLRAAYRLDRAAVNAGLRQVVGLPMVTTDHAEAVATALAAHEEGVDFADALHAALCPPGVPLTTLDRRLIKRNGVAGLQVQAMPRS